MQPSLRRLVENRCKRSIAAILGVAEAELYPSLTVEQRNRHRQVVRDTIFAFRDVMVDLMDSLDTGDVVLNELYLMKLDEIHRALTAEPRAVAMAATRGPGEHRSTSDFGGGRPVAAP